MTAQDTARDTKPRDGRQPPNRKSKQLTTIQMAVPTTKTAFHHERTSPTKKVSHNDVASGATVIRDIRTTRTGKTTKNSTGRIRYRYRARLAEAGIGGFTRDLPIGQIQLYGERLYISMPKSSVTFMKTFVRNKYNWPSTNIPLRKGVNNRRSKIGQFKRLHGSQCRSSAEDSGVVGITLTTGIYHVNIRIFWERKKCQPHIVCVQNDRFRTQVCQSERKCFSRFPIDRYHLCK